MTSVTRINVLRPVGVNLTVSAKKTSDERCLCQDADYVARYEQKWPVKIA